MGSLNRTEILVETRAWDVGFSGAPRELGRRVMKQDSLPASWVGSHAECILRGWTDEVSHSEGSSPHAGGHWISSTWTAVISRPEGVDEGAATWATTAPWIRRSPSKSC